MIEGVSSCIVCGSMLLGEEAVRHHLAWHLLVAQASPMFGVDDRVAVSKSGATGKVMDYWVEHGPLHCYTVALDSNRIVDLLQDEMTLIHRPVGTAR